MGLHDPKIELKERYLWLYSNKEAHFISQLKMNKKMGGAFPLTIPSRSTLRYRQFESRNAIKANEKANARKQESKRYRLTVSKTIVDVVFLSLFDPLFCASLMVFAPVIASLDSIILVFFTSRTLYVPVL